MRLNNPLKGATKERTCEINETKNKIFWTNIG